MYAIMILITFPGKDELWKEITNKQTKTKQNKHNKNKQRWTNSKQTLLHLGLFEDNAPVVYDR